MELLDEEEENNYFNSNYDHDLSEENIQHIPEDERIRRFSIQSDRSRASINPASARGSIRGSIQKRSSIRGSIQKRSSINPEMNQYTIDETEEDDEHIGNRTYTRNSFEVSRKQSFDHYASVRASRESILSEEYIRGDSHQEHHRETLPPNTSKRKIFCFLLL